MVWNEIMGVGREPSQYQKIIIDGSSYSTAASITRTITIPRNCKILGFLCVVSNSTASANLIITAVLTRNGSQISSAAVTTSVTGAGVNIMYETGGMLVGAEAYLGEQFVLTVTSAGGTAGGNAALSILYQEI